MSNVYGKIPIVAGQAQLIEIGGSGLAGIVVGNESGLTCTLSMQGANVTRTLYAGTVDWIPVPRGINWTGNLIITPSADLNNTSYWPSSFIQIDSFGLGESPGGVYPMNLNRTGNIGNQVTTAVGSSTSVQNDNNASGTEFIEATVLGSPTSNEAHFNDGSGWLGRWNNPTFTKIFQWFSTGTTALKLGAVGSFLVEVLGNLQVDGNEVVTGTGSWNSAGATIDNTSTFNGNAVSVSTASIGTASVGTVNCTTTNAVTLHSTGATNTDGNLVVGGTAGVTGDTQLSTVSASGLATLTGGATTAGNITANTFTVSGGGAKLTLLQGSISRIAKKSAAIGVGKTTVAHGLGATPDMVLITPNLTSQPVASTIGCDYSTLSSANVDIWSSVATNVVVTTIHF